MPQLICKDLSLGYEGKKLIKNLNFSVQEGDYLCILGENGAGKSTLLKALLGLKKAMTGKITFGHGISNKDFGFLTQRLESQKDFPASVKEIVFSGLQTKAGLRPFYSKNEKNIAYLAMEKMNILSLSNSCFRDLSGGQQQRVLLSRALCASNKILFLDEPVTGLDVYASNEFYNIINDLNIKENMTIIMVSHDLDIALKYATHILYIGEEKFYGTKESYLNNRSSFNFNITKGDEI